MVERKRIQIIDYRGSKALTTTNIEDKLKEEDEGLKIDTFYDPSKARKVEGIIKKMLAEKGYPFATVKHEAKTIGGAGQQVSFTITDGPKAQIKEIDFAGNEKFTDGELRGQHQEAEGRRASSTCPGSGARPPTPRTSGSGARKTRGTPRGCRTSS